MRATGFGLSMNGVGLGRWLSPTFASVGTLRLAHGVALSIEAEGLTPLVRDRFVADGMPLFRAPVFDGRALLGIRFEVP
ncbi:Hypothetical protein A7982_04577 [Minicystis rosea]|nr:Hypothetical protein A7982_04577 [Minicystis rosea]